MAKGPNTHQAANRKRPVRQADTKPRPQGGGSQFTLKPDKSTLKLIHFCGSIRMTIREAAMKLGVSTTTLEAFLDLPEVREAWEKGEAAAHESLRSAQFKLAKTNATMAIHLGKTYLGQKDEVKVSGTVTLETLVLESLKTAKPDDEDDGQPA